MADETLQQSPEFEMPQEMRSLPSVPSDVVTVSALRQWVPTIVAAFVFFAGLLGSYYSLKADDTALGVKVQAAQVEMDHLKDRTARLESSDGKTQEVMQEILRKLDRLLCRQYPNECKL